MTKQHTIGGPEQFIEKGEQYTHEEYGEIRVESINLEIMKLTESGGFEATPLVRWRSVSHQGRRDTDSGQSPYDEFFKAIE